MCIIIYKSGKAKLPDEKTLKACASSNKDGFGMMVREEFGDRVAIVKGCYKIDEVINLVGKVPKDAEAAFHFRLATHGNVCSQNCHPFPITRWNDALRTTNGIFESGLVHNGIISEFGDRLYNCKDANDKLSDTMNFVKYLHYKTNGRLTFDNVKYHVKGHYGKFVMFVPGRTYWFGDFIEDKALGGLKFSNGGYKEYTYKNMNGAGIFHKSTKDYGKDYDKIVGWDIPTANWFTNTKNAFGYYLDYKKKRFYLKDTSDGCCIEICGVQIPLIECVTLEEVYDLIDECLEAFKEDGVIYATP